MLFIKGNVCTRRSSYHDHIFFLLSSLCRSHSMYLYGNASNNICRSIYLIWMCVKSERSADWMENEREIFKQDLRKFFFLLCKWNEEKNWWCVNKKEILNELISFSLTEEAIFHQKDRNGKTRKRNHCLIDSSFYSLSHFAKGVSEWASAHLQTQLEIFYVYKNIKGIFRNSSICNFVWTVFIFLRVSERASKRRKFNFSRVF